MSDGAMKISPATPAQNLGAWISLEEAFRRSGLRNIGARRRRCFGKGGWGERGLAEKRTGENGQVSWFVRESAQPSFTKGPKKETPVVPPKQTGLVELE